MGAGRESDQKRRCIEFHHGYLLVRLLCSAASHVPARSTSSALAPIVTTPASHGRFDLVANPVEQLVRASVLEALEHESNALEPGQRIAELWLDGDRMQRVARDAGGATIAPGAKLWSVERKPPNN